MRKCCPSGETSQPRVGSLVLQSGCLNNNRGLLAENVVVVRTSATQSSQTDLKKSCFPSRDQAGSVPPAEETCVFTSSLGNGRTYTSFRSDSLETYASQCPSGENSGNDSSSRELSKGVTRRLLRSSKLIFIPLSRDRNCPPFRSPDPPVSH